MASNAAADTVPGRSEPVMKMAEEWAHEKKVPESYLAGVKHRNRWGKGKAVSEKEFDAAVKAFLEAPADGRKR